MGTNLQESSSGWFKLTNEILNIKENILCEVPVLLKVYVVDDNLIPRASHHHLI